MMVRAEPIPPSELFLQVSVTSRCNLRCTHCYVDEAPCDIDPELFAEAIRQSSDLRARLGVERAWVQLSGGEPLMHPQFREILEQCAAAFPTKVLTNGTVLDHESVRLLADHCESVQVSFDGDRLVHDARRGEGSFDAALAGLKRLREAGLPTSARITVGDDNCERVESLFRLLEPHIDAFHLSRVVPMGGCGVNLPVTQAYRRVIYRLYALRSSNPKIRMTDPFFGVLMSTDDATGSHCGCSAGISGLCVTETGDILPCRRLPITLGNIRDASLADVYFSDPLFTRLRARELGGACGECEHKAHCAGSRCVAYALTRDPLAADPGCIYA